MLVFIDYLIYSCYHYWNFIHITVLIHIFLIPIICNQVPLYNFLTNFTGTVKPFRIIYHTNNVEFPNDQSNRGFALNYVQQPCTNILNWQSCGVAFWSSKQRRRIGVIAPKRPINQVLDSLFSVECCCVALNAHSFKFRTGDC